MHRYQGPLVLAVEPPPIGLPCTPRQKPSTPLDTCITPRLRTSMSSHSRLMPDALLDEGRLIQTILFNHVATAQQTEEGKQRGGTELMDLPEEIQQMILDMLMGELQPTALKVTERNHALRNWNHAMRHPRGRRLADLSLVTPSWRRLIQERLYRHIKIQGTQEGLRECYSWFGTHPHLGSYVRHIEFWVPVWERRGGQRDLRDPKSTTPMDMAVQLNDRLNFNFVTGDGSTTAEPLNSAYRLSSQKSTLSEIFYCVDALFQSACVLSIEGGHCKKPPMIEHFRSAEKYGHSRFETLPHIQTLVLRGAWNIMRDGVHFETISEALPNVNEWHCSFTKPKSRAYFMMYSVIQNFPPTLTHMNLCLEGFYSKKSINIAKMQYLQRDHHLCEAVGRIMPQLEALTLTGRMCGHIFAYAIDAASKIRRPRLKSLDLVVKNCCRGVDIWNDGTGIHNWSFILAFENLVTVSSKALRFYPELSFLRIRFVDLDAPAPLLNPYFQLQNNELTGIWNEAVLGNIEVARPNARYADIVDGMTLCSRTLHGYPVHRPKSMRTSIYHVFAADGPF